MGNDESIQVSIDVPTAWYKAGAYDAIVSKDEVLANVWSMFNGDAVVRGGLSSAEIQALLTHGRCVSLSETAGRFWNTNGGYAWNGYRAILQLAATYFEDVAPGEAPAGSSGSPCLGMSGQRDALFRGDDMVRIVVHGPRFNFDLEQLACADVPEAGLPLVCDECQEHTTWWRTGDTEKHGKPYRRPAWGSDFHEVDWDPTEPTDWSWPGLPVEVATASNYPPMVPRKEGALVDGPAARTLGGVVHLRADLIGEVSLAADWMLHWAHVAWALYLEASEGGEVWTEDAWYLWNQARYLGRYALTYLLSGHGAAELVHELAHILTVPIVGEGADHLYTEQCCACTTARAFETGVAARLGLAIPLARVAWYEDILFGCMSWYSKTESGCSGDSGVYNWEVSFATPCEYRGERNYEASGCDSGPGVGRDERVEYVVGV